MIDDSNEKHNDEKIKIAYTQEFNGSFRLFDMVTDRDIGGVSEIKIMRSINNGCQVNFTAYLHGDDGNKIDI